MAVLLLMLSLLAASPLQKPSPKIRRPVQVVAPLIDVEIPPHLHSSVVK